VLEGYERDLIWPTTLSPTPSSLFINKKKRYVCHNPSSVINPHRALTSRAITKQEGNGIMMMLLLKQKLGE
jgi:hypothetical protein